jgi:hypothetical protein
MQHLVARSSPLRGSYPQSYVSQHHPKALDLSRVLCVAPDCRLTLQLFVPFVLCLHQLKMSNSPIVVSRVVAWDIVGKGRMLCAGIGRRSAGVETVVIITADNG